MNKKLNKLFLVQFFIALLGTLFAFTSVFFDYKRFYAIEGSLTKLKDCSIPNPVLTPCFWGAFGFLAATIWAFTLYKKALPRHSKLAASAKASSEDRNSESNGYAKYGIVKNQQKFFTAFAAFGTAFAWSNMTLELIKYFKAAGQTYTGCSGILVTNPLLTPCFGGSVIFLSLFVISVSIYKYIQKSYGDV